MENLTRYSMSDHPTIEEATKFFAEIYYGEHQIPSKIKPFGSGWAINHFGDVATHDFNMLTRMVFLAHDMCYRLQIQQGAPGSIKIVIWKRSARTGDISYRHPTLEQALAKWRETHKDEEARQDIMEAGEQPTTIKGYCMNDQVCQPRSEPNMVYDQATLAPALSKSNFHKVSIDKVANGFIVVIGCQTFVTKTWVEASEGLAEYYTDPVAAEKKFCAA